MNKKQKRTEKLMQKYIEKWSWIVTSYGWKFNAYYCTKKEFPKEAGSDGAGYIWAQFQYLQGNIYFSLDKLKNFDSKEIESVVVHELTHMLTCPLAESKKNLEYTTESISRVLLGLDRDK